MIESGWVKNMSKRLTVIKIAIKHIFSSDVSLQEKERGKEREKEGGILAPNYKERTWLLLSVIGLYSPSL